MKKIKLLLLLCAVMVFSDTVAQTLQGTVYSSEGYPLQDAVVSSSGVESVQTDQSGHFQIEGVVDGAYIKVWAPGFFSQELKVKGDSKVSIVLVRDDAYKYNESAVLPYRIENTANLSGARNLSKKDFALGSSTIDRAMQGEFAGLQVVNKSGMTGEGAYMALQGIQTLSADNAPLVVINGVPYMPDKDESQLIGGYSRSIFQAINVQDIQNITVLRGAEASLYGSLGSNGVILIETDGATSDDMNTKISYSGQFGFNWNNRRIPLMGVADYKSYLSDVGLTYYDNMETFFTDFPFLKGSDNPFNYYYQYDTDWQDYLYQNGMTTDHLVRVEGGDAIAKYDISLGYMRDEGTLQNTYSDRFNTQINTNVLVSKQFEISTNLSLAYLNGRYQEQGMRVETNPLLAAYKRAPLLSPYKSDMYGDLLETYSSYYFGANTNTDFIVSNPLAIIHTASEEVRQYDVNMKIQLAYKPTNHLSLNAALGLYYNYDQQGVFIPGVNNSDIVPIFDTYGEAANTVRQGVATTFNMFYNVNAAYTNKFDRMLVDLRLGGQVLTTSNEYDMGSGRNTANDFYQTLGDVNGIGVFFSGYTSAWNWLNAYARASFTWDDYLNMAFNVSTDGASSTGKDTQRMGVYPSGSVMLMAKQLSLFRDMDFFNKVNLWADYGLTGNSRFSGNYGKYFYTSRPYQMIAGIIRANVPNTKIKWEENRRANLGLDLAMWKNRVNLSAAAYINRATDVLMLSNTSSAYGTSLHYSNDAAITSRGYDISLQVAPVYNKNFKWIIGGSVSALNNKVSSLGNEDMLVSTLSDDAAIITKVGENPYSFYGYEVEGVFSTISEANEANLKNSNGIAYEAGDMHYVDQNTDGIINHKDRVILGSATPDLFGTLYNRFEYRGLALDVTWGYSLGNEAYNATRRYLESADDFGNQSKALLRRWTMDGQMTDIPRANYGDVIGNNDFSERWIEDASYLKLRDVTLSYTFKTPLWKVFQGGTVYVTGQNLLCFTNYLGADPEFAYSYTPIMQGVDYAKVAMPRTVKLGVNLNF